MTPAQFINLFFSFSGRIGRKTWWLAMLALLATELSIGFLMDPNYLSVSDEPQATQHLGSFIWSIAFYIPSSAVTIKRLNDRNWPTTVHIAYFACLAVFMIADTIDFLAPVNLNSPQGELVILSLAPFILFVIWVLIDNGFMRGTRGTNYFGPDPLDNNLNGTPT